MRKFCNSPILFVGWTFIFTACLVCVRPQNVRADSFDNEGIRVTGTAEVRASPDRVRFSVAVVTVAATAKAAGRKNAAASDAVSTELEKKVASNGEVSTGSFSLNPNYSWVKNGGEQKRVLRGYTATNRISVKTSDLDSVGPLVDVAVAEGANEVGNIEFFLADAQAVRRQATLEAGRRARQLAATVAESLGVTLGRLVEASTASPATPQRYMARAQMSEGVSRAVSTPIKPGDLTIKASLSVRFAVE